MAGVGIYHLLTVPNANCFVGAADKVQAKEYYRFASHFIDSEPELQQYARVLKGTLEIRSLRDEGFIQVIASDDSKQGGKNQGFNPTLAFVDELHAHENDALYTDMRSGLFKRNGILVVISTAGWDQESALGKLRKRFLTKGDVVGALLAYGNGRVKRDLQRGRLTIARMPSGNSVMLEWASRGGTRLDVSQKKDGPPAKPDDYPADNTDDLEIVKLANPASWVTVASLKDAKESLTPWSFLRYRCNLWTLTFESWIPVGSWERLEESGVELDPDLPLVAGLDMARYRDCAALVVVQPRPNPDYDPDDPDTDEPEYLGSVVKAWIWRSGGPDNPIPYEVVEDQIRWLHEHFTLNACAYDPRYFDKSAEDLEGEGIAMEEAPQSLERQCMQADLLRRAILDRTYIKLAEAGDPRAEKFRRLVHDGDPTLAAHVMAATAKEVGTDRFKLDKARKNGPDIDAAEALAMAWAISDLTEQEPLIAWG